MIAVMLGLQRAAPLGSASTNATSDLDMNFEGAAAGTGLVRSRADLDRLFPGWDKLYKMGLVVSTERLTSLSDELRTAQLKPGEADRQLSENATLAEQLLVERRLRHMSEAERATVLANYPEDQRADLARRATMTPAERREEQNKYLVLADQLHADLRNEKDPRRRVAIASDVSSAQMYANSLSDDMYVTMQAGVDISGNRTAMVSNRHAYLATIDQIDMLHHLVDEHGGILNATMRYEVPKYASRILENLERSGIFDARIEPLLKKALHVYKVDREANARGGNVFGLREFETLRALLDEHMPRLRATAHLGGEDGPSEARASVTQLPKTTATDEHTPRPQATAHLGGEGGPSEAQASVTPLPKTTAVDFVSLPPVSSKKTSGVFEAGKIGVRQQSTTLDKRGTKTTKNLSGSWVSGGIELGSSGETDHGDGGSKKHDTSVKVTTEGLDVTRNGKSVKFAKDELGGGYEKSCGKYKVGASFSVKSGTSTEQLDARFAEGAAGVLASLLPIPDEATDPTNIRSIADTTGYKAGGSVGAESGAFGASVEASMEDYDTTRFFTTEKAQGADQNERSSILQLRERAELSGKLSGVKAISDVDLEKLKEGEGYSFEHKGAKSVAGSVTAYGVSAGLGYSDAGFEQTALAKTGDSSYRVTMTATSDEETAGHVGFKGLSLAGASGSGTDASVSFSASGPEGVAALKGFQATGLLPGAEAVVRARDPAGWQAFANDRAALETAMKGGNPFEIDTARRSVFAASKDLNRMFMDSNGWSLPEATIPGVNYDEHMTGRSNSESVGLKLGPLDLMHSVTERMWQRDYRTGTGAKTELGASQSVHNIIDPDESESSITAPKGNSGAAWLLSEEGTLGSESRQRLARTGPQFMAGPKEMQDSWVGGDYHDAVKNQVAMAFTEDQMAEMRDKVAVMKPEDAQGFLDDLTMIRKISGLDEMRESGAALSVFAGPVMSMALRPWVKQLNDLEEAANDARRKRISEGEAAGLQHGGLFGNTTLTAKQLSEEFESLSKEERRLIVVGGAIAGAEKGYGKGWNALKLALRVKDTAERNELLREIFAAVARRDDDANAPMELLAYLEDQATKEGVPREQLNAIVSGTQVGTMDPGPQVAAKQWREELRLKGMEAADKWAAQKLSEAARLRDHNDFGGMQNDSWGAMAENEGNVAQNRADHITDLLEGVAGTGGPAGLQKAIDVALATDPTVLLRMKVVLAGDPVRLAIVRDLLKSTDHRLP